MVKSICFNQKNIQYYSSECQDLRNQVFQRISNEFLGRNKNHYVDIKYDHLFPEVLKRPTTYNLSKLNYKSDDTMFAAGWFGVPKKTMIIVGVADSFVPFVAVGVLVGCVVSLVKQGDDPCSNSYNWSGGFMGGVEYMATGKVHPHLCKDWIINEDN